MRYRIIVEVDTANASRRQIDDLAQRVMNETVTRFSNPVYLATEVVTDKQRCILREDDDLK